jgi:hypothetical protein
MIRPRQVRTISRNILRFRTNFLCRVTSVLHFSLIFATKSSLGLGSVVAVAIISA